MKHLASRAVLTFISVSLLVNLAYQISQIRIKSQQENLPENLQLLLIYQHQHYNLKIAVQYFLQRMQPYAMVHGKFASDQEIIDFITEDLKRFENAKNSHNFNTFLLISHLGHHITENIEQLFLNYNVDADKK